MIILNEVRNGVSSAEPLAAIVSVFYKKNGLFCRFPSRVKFATTTLSSAWSVSNVNFKLCSFFVSCFPDYRFANRQKLIVNDNRCVYYENNNKRRDKLTNIDVFCNRFVNFVLNIFYISCKFEIPACSCYQISIRESLHVKSFVNFYARVVIIINVSKMKNALLLFCKR